MLCAGKCRKHIADVLGITEGTLRVHRHKLRVNTGCKTGVQLGVWAVRHGYAK